jgi:flagellar hook-length control protein FliK
VTSVAANIATHGHAATAIGSSGTNTSPADDGFAAILGNLIQAPANDKASVAASAVQSDDPADTSSDSDSETAVDTASRALQSLHPLQEIKPSADQACQPLPSSDGTSDPGAVLVSLTQGASDGTATPPSTSLTDRGTDASPRLARGAKSDPAQVASSDVAPDKPAVNANQAIDPILAQMAAAQQAVQQQAVPAAATPQDPSTSAPTGIQADPAQAAVDALDAPATDVVASSILTGGATTKPVKPGATDDGKAPADSEKAQTQDSTAAALADTAAARAFTDQRVSAAHALPLHIGSDAAKNNNGQSGGSPSDQQKPANTAAPAQAQAADVPAAGTNTNFTPAHAQAVAPQPEASAAANAAAANSAASVPAASVGTPAQTATQLQVSHPAAAAPDINSLAFNIATKSEGGARHFDIRLDPAELGRVDIRLTVDDAGKAQATLSVEKPQTLELLQKDQGHLERALKDAGLDLSQNGLNFSLKGQQQQSSSGGNASSSRSRTLAVRAIAAADAAATNLSLGSAASSDTRLDIRV